METSILNEDFDVFIAYHGTSDPNGSLAMANTIYEQLSKIAKCFFMPITAPTNGFTDTPTIATHSKLFVLVANDTILLNNKYSIESPGLYNEIDAFYKAHFNDKPSPSNYARVFAYDGLTANKADSFHVIFRGQPHFEDFIPNSINKLISWVQSSLNLSSSLIKEHIKLSILPKINYEGLWTVFGDFPLFQGEKNTFSSVGRLLIQRSATGYKVLYCYSVSKEYSEHNCVTAICEGNATVEKTDNNNEILHIVCDIIARTSDTNLQSNHFNMTIIPHANGMMTADYITKKTQGKIVFTKKE